jgi:hypothetical protein
LHYTYAGNDCQLTNDKEDHMNKLLILVAALLALNAYSAHVLAGVPQTTMDCKSASGHAAISGYPVGEGYDLKIKVDNAAIRYTNVCDGDVCPEKENYGDLYVVDAMYDKIFTIYFVNTEHNNRGIFYALPDSVKYKKNSRGYAAQYKAIYFGDDPRSTEPFKESVKAPGIELVCTQEDKL